MLDPATYLDVLRTRGDRLAATPPEALEARVPGCPEWNVGELLAHVGFVYRWVAATVRAGEHERVSRSSIETGPAGAAVVSWFADALDEVRTTLSQADPDAPVQTFVGVQPGRFYLRRMAQETLVHDWDAQSASGDPEPIPAELAIDGVDEALVVYLPRKFDYEAVAPGTTLHLHATDIPEGNPSGEWMLTFGTDAETSRFEHGHRKADAAVRGSASDLLLFLFGRVPAGRLECFGDPSLPATFQDAAAF